VEISEHRIVIDLDRLEELKPLEKSEGRYAYLRAIPKAAIVFASVLAIVYGSVYIAEQLGWHKTGLDTQYTAALLFVTALLLASLVNAASQRFSEDQADAGAIGTAIRVIASEISSMTKLLEPLTLLNTLEGICWHIYFQFEEVPVEILGDEEGKPRKGVQPLLSLLSRQLRSSSMPPEQRQDVSAQLAAIQGALGRIARRRAHPILFSRYAINGMFCFVSLTLLALPAAIGGKGWLLSLLLTFLVAYGLTTVLTYVKQMESGIGYDPGDIKPRAALAAWLVEVEAAGD